MNVRLVAPLVVVAVVSAACSGSNTATPSTTTTVEQDVVETTVPSADDVVSIVSDGRLATEWQDYGWAATIDAASGVSIDFGDYGGWIVAQPELDDQFSRVRLAFDAAESLGEEFLAVQVSDDVGSSFPLVVPVLERDGTSVAADVSVGDLDPSSIGFDRVIFTATDEFPSPSTVQVRNLGLVRVPEGSLPDPGAPQTTLAPPTEVAVGSSIQCAAETTPISPHIYGINQEFGNMPDEDWSLGAASRRWGGNATSRYNWRTGSWNTAFDYYFRNVSDEDGPAHVEFLTENDERDISSALTVPMIGWVAKDDTSASFPVSVVGAQPNTDPFNDDFGDGIGPDGSELTPLDPTTTSERSTPDDIREWVTTLNDDAADGGPAAPFLYFLDNEPMLWNSTHRDVVTEPLGYDELLERTIDYATAVREAQPDALIGGPSVWGWPAYFFSAIDAEEGFGSAPDRQAHAGEPLIEWYLAELRAHEERTGVRLLDVLDVHFYPQDGSYSEEIDDSSVARRLRTTRSLWDTTYLEESWIEEQVGLIPRMQDWVDEHAPGTLLSIGEYAFGAEQHISGGLAQAEALGRFGQFGLFAAYYWDVPPSGSPVYWAFRAFRDYDGAGSTFGDLSVPTESDRSVSLFASTTAAGDSHVAVVLNLSPDPQPAFGIDIAECGRTDVVAYQYAQGSSTLAPAGAAVIDGTVGIDLPGHSITVLELR